MSQSSSVLDGSQTSCAPGLIAALPSLQSPLFATSPEAASHAERAEPVPNASLSPSTYQLVLPVAPPMSASSANVSQSSSVFDGSQTSCAPGLIAAFESSQSPATSTYPIGGEVVHAV